MNRLRWVGVAAVLLLVAGCESVPPPAGGSDRAFVNVEEYRIGVDDRVQVTVWRNPELSVTVPVRPDGKISVPLIGDVEAGGRTPTEVAGGVPGKTPPDNPPPHPSGLPSGNCTPPIPSPVGAPPWGGAPRPPGFFPRPT